MTVCSICGAEVAQNRAGRWIHIESPPENTPDHDAEPVSRTVQVLTRVKVTVLKGAAGDMLTHHAQLCPASVCPFAQNLADAIKAVD